MPLIVKCCYDKLHWAHIQARVGGESDYIQGWQGSILKPIGDRWSNPPIYMLVILSLILQCETIISNSHVGFTLNTPPHM